MGESWRKSLKPVIREKIPMTITTWNTYEELAPTILHLNNMFREVFQAEQIQEENIEILHEAGEKIVEMIVEEEEKEEGSDAKNSKPKVTLNLEHKLNPFASQVTQQHDKRLNLLRRANWGMIKMTYSTE